jgi:hypothetical protein
MASLVKTEDEHSVDVRTKEYQPTERYWHYFICNHFSDLVYGNKYTSWDEIQKQLVKHCLCPNTLLNVICLGHRRTWYHLWTPVPGAESFQHSAAVTIKSPIMVKQFAIAISSCYRNCRSGLEGKVDIKKCANLPLDQRQVKSQIMFHVVGN